MLGVDRRRPAHWMWAALIVLSVVRVVGIVQSGLVNTRGDFYSTLPGEYVRDLNPSLWNSPDLAQSSSFQQEQYLYGPTQFLTLYPLALVDTYADISMILLVAYGVLLIAACVVVIRLFTRAPNVGFSASAAVVVAASLYLPLLQAYIQREFETVTVVIHAAALYAIVTRREWLAGLALGYVTWFKLFPIVFLPYFIARRWWRAVGGYLTGSAVVLIAAHFAFDLGRFGSFFGLANYSTDLALQFGGTCEDWLLTNETIVNLRWGMCRLLPLVNNNIEILEVLFWVPLVAAALVFARTFLPISSKNLPDPAQEQMRRLLEFAIIMAFSVGIFYGHYYYLAMLFIPIGVLMYRYASDPDRRRVKVWLLVLSYLLLTAGAVPVSVTSTLTGVNVWSVYTYYSVPLFGQAILVVLLLWEHAGFVKQATGTRVAPPVSAPAHALPETS